MRVRACVPQGWCWGLLLTLLVALPFSALAGAEFEVEEVHSRLEGGAYIADAKIDYRFTPQALEALNNGVPLTVLVHVQVRRLGAWIWEDSLTDIRLRYAIRFKPLSEQYEVYRVPSDGGRSFISREAAIAALGEIEGLQLVNAERLEPGERYEVQMRVELEIEELPLPLRPMAYLSPSWKLASDWSKWPLSP